MKRRKPLRRKTELKRGGSLPRVSKKRRQLMAKVKQDRNDLRTAGNWCEACGEVFDELTVHEIAKGTHREKALEHRCCQLRVCWNCNAGPLNDYAKWPLERQLARVLVNRAQDFDLATFNSVRGRAPTAITLEDVARWLQAL